MLRDALELGLPIDAPTGDGGEERIAWAAELVASSSARAMPAQGEERTVRGWVAG